MKNDIVLKGMGVSEGIAIGKVLVYENEELLVDYRNIDSDSIDQEISRFMDAINKAKKQYQDLKNKFKKEVDEKSTKVLDFYLLLLSDIMVINKTVDKIKNELNNSEYIFDNIIKEYIKNIESKKNQYFIERIPDIISLKRNVLRILIGSSDNKSLTLQNLKSQSIIVSHDLSASDIASLNKEKLLGVATDKGGLTSHTAILARQLEVPAVIGLEDITSNVKTGDKLILDGKEGIVIINPKKETLEDYKKKQIEFLKLSKKYMKNISEKAMTKDGRRIEVGVNMSIDESLEHIKSYGGEGVGLLRTEFIFLDRIPTEEEQYLYYKKIADGLYPDSVIIRTVDVGGDKRIKGWDYQEVNPFLGFRAIRYCLKHLDFFKAQLRAIIRANVKGNVKLMIPMISNLDEIIETKQIVEELKKDLKKEGYEFDEKLPFGIMVETPAAVMEADILAKYVDFFSIGSNDLTQYTLAADRGNSLLGNIFNHYSPAVLRLIARTVEIAQANNVWVGLCGEMASESKAILFLVSLGINELSMTLQLIPRAKDIIRKLNYEEIKYIKDEVLSLQTASEIMEYLDNKLYELKIT